WWAWWSMSEPGLPAVAPPRLATPVSTASVPIFLATFAIVVAAIALFLGLDLFLARVDRQESRGHAADEYAAGRTLLAAGKPRDAAERFGAAVAIDRQNVNYSLALGEAMLEEGRTADAEATIKALLDRAENDGAVNLTMAHVMAREDRYDDAQAYYHRAIFGQWGADSLARRTQARFELIDVLARRGSQAELLAELLPFDATSPDSIALRSRLGRLFILAGAPARAATMFREVLRRQPRDAGAWAGMGDAALALRTFQTARADLVEALRLRPHDPGITRSLALADTVLAIDPIARDIGVHEQYLRSKTLLARTLATLASCFQTGPSATSDSARTLLATTPAAQGEKALANTMLSRASDLYAARPASCAAVKRDDALRLVQNRLVQ
ncbi:MAG TPA: tetratricopeptide repeat protein, partial [Gemmatimonadaceae bacterium]